LTITDEAAIIAIMWARSNLNDTPMVRASKNRKTNTYDFTVQSDSDAMALMLRWG